MNRVSQKLHGCDEDFIRNNYISIDLIPFSKHSLISRDANGELSECFKYAKVYKDDRNKNVSKIKYITTYLVDKTKVFLFKIFILISSLLKKKKFDFA